MQGAGHTHPGSGGYTMVSSGMRGVGAYRWRSEIARGAPKEPLRWSRQDA